MGMVYVVMAHTRHQGADPADVFFQKRDDMGEYEVMPTRMDAWQDRLSRVTEALLSCYNDRLDVTKTIGF